MKTKTKNETTKDKAAQTNAGSASDGQQPAANPAVDRGVQGVLEVVSTGGETLGKALALKSAALENGATENEFNAGCLIAKQLPGAVQAYAEFKAAESSTRSRFFTFMDKLREQVVLKALPGDPRSNDLPPHRLNGREVQTLMFALGEPKQRVTEFKRVHEMPDELYAAARKLCLSKIETLALARGTKLLEKAADGEPVKLVEAKAATPPSDNPDTGDGSKGKPVEKPSYHRFDNHAAEAFHDLVVVFAAVLPATSDSVPYQIKGMTTDGREYVLNLFVDSVPLKPAAEASK